MKEPDGQGIIEEFRSGFFLWLIRGHSTTMWTTYPLESGQLGTFRITPTLYLRDQPLLVNVFNECSLIDILIAWWSRWIWGIYGWRSYGFLRRLVWAKICQKSSGWHDERRWGRNGGFCHSQQRKMGWKLYGKFKTWPKPNFIWVLLGLNFWLLCLDMKSKLWYSLSSYFLRRPQKLTKSSTSIWCLLHSIKSTVKISSIFVAFLENIKFTLSL